MPIRKIYPAILNGLSSFILLFEMGRKFDRNKTVKSLTRFFNFVNFKNSIKRSFIYKQNLLNRIIIMKKKSSKKRKNNRRDLCMGHDQKVAMKNNYIND